MRDKAPIATERAEGSAGRKGRKGESLREEYARFLRPESWTDKAIVGGAMHEDRQR